MNTSSKITDSQKAMAAHALEHYFHGLTEEFCATPPLRRITADKLRPDLLHRLLVDTYQTINCILTDKRVFNSLFRRIFKPYIRKAWSDFPAIS